MTETSTLPPKGDSKSDNKAKQPSLRLPSLKLPPLKPPPLELQGKTDQAKDVNAKVKGEEAKPEDVNAKVKDEKDVGTKTKDVSAKTKNAGTKLPKKPSFSDMYYRFHAKFPEIINLEKPVLLAVGIRKELAEIAGMPGTILNNWLKWYFQKSKYYQMHVEGAKRYNLQGEEAGIVTAEHVLGREKELQSIISRRAEMAQKDNKTEIVQEDTKSS